MYLFLHAFLNVFLLIVLSGRLHAQTAVVQGTVTDANGEVMPGITIFLDDSRGVATDVSGDFTLRNVAPGEHTLTVSGVGYQTKTLPLTLAAGESKPLTIRMDKDAQQLGEVCSAGQRRSRCSAFIS